MRGPNGVAVATAGAGAFIPAPQRGPAVKNGFFRKDEFRYDAARDAYVCPAGQELTPIREGKLRELKKVDYGNAKACRACPLRPRCTKDVCAVSRLASRKRGRARSHGGAIESDGSNS
jgi:transposase